MPSSPAVSLRPESSRALRRLALPPLALDGGQMLHGATLAYHLDGTLAPARDNVVLVLHALTGSADAAGDWWRFQIGAGRSIDTTRWAVLAPNLLGSCYGSSGPATQEHFPALTLRDQARAVAVLLEALEIPRVRLAVGGSLGGMVALELSASFPGRIAEALVFAAPARLGAAAIAWSAVQRQALAVAGADGLALARQIAMLSYRTASGLQQRFGRERDGRGEFAVTQWLRHHGEALVARMDAATYRYLLDVMDTQDLAAGRGGVGERLRASGTTFTGVGIPGDLFCDVREVQDWVHAAGGRYRELQSPQGHDAFLIEHAQVSALLAEVLTARPHPLRHSVSRAPLRSGEAVA